jgi:hypothetical protein
MKNNKKSKAIPVTVRGGLKGCGTLTIPHCLDNRLTYGGKVVSLKRRQHITPQNIIFLFPVLISVRG